MKMGCNILVLVWTNLGQMGWEWCIPVQANDKCWAYIIPPWWKLLGQGRQTEGEGWV